MCCVIHVFSTLLAHDERKHWICCPAIPECHSSILCYAFCRSGPVQLLIVCQDNGGTDFGGINFVTREVNHKDTT